MAYASLAQLTPAFGLYTSFTGACLYWIFGTSRDIVIGASIAPCCNTSLANPYTRLPPLARFSSVAPSAISKQHILECTRLKRLHVRSVSLPALSSWGLASYAWGSSSSSFHTFLFPHLLHQLASPSYQHNCRLSSVSPVSTRARPRTKSTSTS